MTKRLLLILLACSSVLLAGCAEYKPNDYVDCKGNKGYVKAESKNMIYIEEGNGRWRWTKSHCTTLVKPPKIIWSISGAEEKILQKGLLENE